MTPVGVATKSGRFARTAISHIVKMITPAISGATRSRVNQTARGATIRLLYVAIGPDNVQ